MADETKLKPCPFCGGEVETGYYCEEFVVDCTNCQYQISTYDDGPNDPSVRGIEHWNTRATMDKADMARTLQKLIQTEGLDAAYVWLGEVATGEEPEFSLPTDRIYET